MKMTYLFARGHLGLTLYVAIALISAIPQSVSAQANAGTVSWNAALNQAPEWYGSAEAIRIGDNVLVFQHPTGGWPKNVDLAVVLDEEAIVRIREEQGNRGDALGQPTIDNGATSAEMLYLARVYGATEDERFKRGFLKGLDYLLESQYDNGGWPQFYPIREGYYQRITFNDGAMIRVMRILKDISDRKAPYGIVDEERMRRVENALAKGIDVILKCQIEVDGRLTAWCAQHDERDLSPAGARSYEHPSISGSESVGIIRFLMDIEEPGPEVIRAVRGAVEWFDAVQIENTRMIETEVDGRRDRIVVEDPGFGSVWARFYEIGTNRPIFSGRDGVVKYDMAEIEHERRVGYRWLGGWGQSLLEDEYPAWREKWVAD